MSYSIQKKYAHDDNLIESILHIPVDVFDSSETESFDKIEKVYFRKRWRKKDSPQSQVLWQSDLKSRSIRHGSTNYH